MYPAMSQTVVSAWETGLLVRTHAHYKTHNGIVEGQCWESQGLASVPSSATAFKLMLGKAHPSPVALPGESMLL